ncbi:MAG TPA: LCP family protein [Ilumatobacteraceae bacterium]|nr:LCP family protein [Ilumatobacteraceae bacterium]
MGAGSDESTAKPYRRRHTAAQRIVLVVNCLVVVLCLTGAAALLIAKHAGEQGRRVALPAPTRRVRVVVDQTSAETTDAATADSVDTTAATATTPPALEAAEPTGENFLIVGIDNNACIDPTSPYAPYIGQRTARLTDTIMMIRVDRATRQAAVLSFPRDLYVRVEGSLRRINTAYRRRDPKPLVDTIYNEFGIETDHFIGVDFCAFMRVVDAVGGVTVPIPRPMRDLTNTGLNITTAGCHTFAGDEALAYVRSRHLEYQNDQGEWRSDNSYDFGRIARQQDFLRRVLSAAKHELLSPSVILGLYESYKDDLVIDDRLTLNDMRELADVLRDFETAGLRTYQIETTGRTISHQAVLLANDSPANTAILDIFRGTAPFIGGVEARAATDPTQSEAAVTTSVAMQPESNPPERAIRPDPLLEC